MPATYEFTPGVVDEICNRLIAGEGVREICASPGMPSQGTYYQHMARDQAFRDRIASAREAAQDAIIDGCRAIADDATPENHQVAKLQIWARQWTASKVAPRRYGDRSSVALTGADGGPIAVKHVEELSELELARIASEGR